jgi:hypothetical protein
LPAISISVSSCDGEQAASAVIASEAGISQQALIAEGINYVPHEVPEALGGEVIGCLLQ